MDEKEIYSRLYKVLDPLVTECVMNRIGVEAITSILMIKGICTHSDIETAIKHVTETHGQQLTKSLVIKVKQGIENLKQ